MTHNRIEVTGQRPGNGDVDKGEITVNTVDGILFGSSDGTAIEDLGGAIVHQNLNKITVDYTLRTGMSGVVASGFIVEGSATLTIPAGSVLSVV